MKKEKSIQVDIEGLNIVLNWWRGTKECFNKKDNEWKELCQGEESITSAISALEGQALMRDASDALPDKKTYQNTGEWCDGGAYLAKGFNSCLDLCQVVTAKLLLEIKELKDAKKE